MALIHEVCHQYNLAVACSIHQPSSQVFYEFDRLLLLSQGRTAFFGKARDAVKYFESIGPTQPYHSCTAVLTMITM